MYRQHFNLEKKPFQTNSDDEFLWLGKKHATALKLLKKGISEEQGLLVLTGDIGTGKTTLINKIIRTLDEDTLFVKIVDPCFELYHLYGVIAEELGFEDHYTSEENFSSEFFSFLKSAGDKGKKIMVIIDEAQRIPDRFLKEILSWSGFGLNRVLTVIIAGQLDFLDVLRANLGKAWKEIIDIHAFLEPLNKKETEIYINKRLELGGADRNIFSVSAAREAYGYSKGTPRLINISCEQALISAFAKDMSVVDAPTFKNVIHQLTLPVPQSENRETDGEEQAEGDKQIHGRQWFDKKNMAFSTAVCICLFITFVFYSGYPHALKKETISNAPAKMKSLEKQGEKTGHGATSGSNSLPNHTEDTLAETVRPVAPEIQKPAEQEIGLRYTPGPYSVDTGYLQPLMTVTVTKNPETTGGEKERSRNLDQFIEEVFEFKAPATSFHEAAPETENATRVEKTAENTLSALIVPPTGKDIEEHPASSVEEEPGAIIDWLIEKRKVK